MKRQNDWYTGIEYSHNEPETDIKVEYLRLEERTKSQFHEKTELYYIMSGRAQLEINGCSYEVSEGSLICMYAHHFYRFSQVKRTIKTLRVSFHIGLFMYMSWERHPQNANAALVYDTCPVVSIEGEERNKINTLALEILEENEQGRFESRNMIAYKTLELHAYHCRYAYEAIGKDNQVKENQTWTIIIRVLLAQSKNYTLEEVAESCGCHPSVLNKDIKNVSGYTFHQLKQIGKMNHACALLHFPELEISYISDMLGFSSKQDFYRVFSRYCHMTPREYRNRMWGDEHTQIWSASAAVRFLQYMNLQFYDDITIKTLCDKFCLKEHTVKNIFCNAFGMSFGELLGQIRISYACAFLRATRQSILGISTLCGFESLSTFQRTFFELMGQTPGEYRKSFSI